MTRTVSAPRLILVTNRATARYPLPELAVRAIAGGVDLVQIREKDLDDADLKRLALSVLEAVREPSRLTINGSPSIAEALGIGLHLPEAMGRPEALNRARIRRLSRSVHSPKSARTSDWADFVIAGHVFATASKPGLTPLDLTGLATIVSASPVPVVAIGGISPDRAGKVLGAGAAGVAVLSAINDTGDPEAAARRFRSALEDGMTTSQETISVTINGKAASVPSGSTVLDYLKERGFHDRLVVVELNGQILAKSAFPSTAISAGDRLEIVHFVGGG